MAYTDVWNENYPSGTTPGNELDTAVTQGVKRALRERLQADHDLRSDESGAEETVTPSGTIGFHKKVTLVKRTSDETEVANCGVLFSKLVSGQVELFYIDDTGVLTQITNNGDITIPEGIVYITGDQSLAGVKTFTGIPVFSAGITLGANSSAGNKELAGLCLENRTDDTGCTQSGRIWLRTNV